MRVTVLGCNDDLRAGFVPKSAGDVPKSTADVADLSHVSRTREYFPKSFPADSDQAVSAGSVSSQRCSGRHLPQ